MRRLARLLVIVPALAWMAPLPAAADMAHGTPNDPQWAQCESQSALTGCTDGEEWDQFGPLAGNTCPDPVTGLPVLPHPDGGLPCWALTAHDPQHFSGMNLPGAWTRGNVGRDDILVAYIEGGTNWSNDGVKDAIDNFYINRGELPYPQRSDGTVKSSGDPYDLNGDGRLDVRDYIDDPRVNPPCPAGVAPFTKIDVEAVSWSCVAGGQHQYVNRVNVQGHRQYYLSPEDLIAVFGHCRIAHGLLLQCPPGGRFDNDGNGYPNDVSGWNFDHNNNDPQTDDTTYSHAPGLNSLIAGVADNGYGSVGFCPRCRVVAVKQGAECLGRTDRWGESILYATDLGATAISSVVVGYTFSKFNQDAIDYAYNRGVALSMDSNDFDSMDHTDGMLFDHVIPGNSLAEDKSTMGAGPANTASTVTWFRERSNVTSYGTHNIFQMEGGSTSAATPTVASMLAMTQSAALNARDAGTLPIDRLSPNEIKQVIMDTASKVVPQDLPAPAGDGAPAGTLPTWPGNPNSATDATHTNWSTQYGYGRPDAGAFTAFLMSGKLPPTADLTTPHWYQYVDPVTTPSLEVDGSLAPARVHSGGSAHYVLEFALGADPADSAFTTVSSGSVAAGLNGRLGVIDLSKVPSSFYTGTPGTTLQPDGAEQYTATIRLRVWDANGIKAEDRRSIGLRHDPNLTAGYPKDVSRSDGDAAPSFVDLEGRHELDLVLATSNGEVHAWRPDGTEVPGFPVLTARVADIDPNNPQNLAGVPAYRVPALRDVRDPISGGVAVGDLFHNGELEIVATTTNADVYAWDGHGVPLPGFPVHSNPAYWSQVVPTPHNFNQNHPRNPSRGNWSPPVLADLEGTGRLDVIMTAFDGFVYAWRPDGTVVPGWPVEVKLPPAIFSRDGVDPARYIRDAKLMYPAGVADMEKTGRPQVFVPSFESNGTSTATQDLVASLEGINLNGTPAKTWMYGIWPDGNNHPGGPFIPNWPVAVPTLDFAYDQSIDFVGESTSPPVFGDFDGSGTLRMVTGAVTGQVLVFNPDGSVFQRLDLSCQSADCGPNPPYRPTGDTHTLTLTGIGGLGDLTNSGTPQFIMNNTGLESILTGLGGQVGAALPQVYEKAWNVATGRVLQGWPKRVDGFPFYSSPLTADVTGSGGRAAIEGNDNYWIHAFNADGSEAPGFPKYTGQWEGFASVIADPLMNGRLHYVMPTHEGFVFDWAVQGDTRLNNSWWHYRHDEHNSGLYGLDTRRPAAVTDLAVAGSGPLTLTWTAPGDDYMVGTADHFDVRWSSSPISPQNFDGAIPLSGAPPPVPAGGLQRMTVSGLVASSIYIALRTRDRAGNISAMSNLACVGVCPAITAAPPLPNTRGAGATPALLPLALLLPAGLGRRRRAPRSR